MTQSRRLESLGQWQKLVQAAGGLLVLLVLLIGQSRGSWRRHTIDRASRGADGARLADVDGNGWLDVVTAWEEGGEVRICFHPGPQRCRIPWPAVTVGRVKSPEDAVLVDVDGDGRHDVISCCEGAERSVYVHWAPADPADYAVAANWQTIAVPAVQGKQMWMFALPLDIDHQGALDLVIGSKGVRGEVGWLQIPAAARQVSEWGYRQIRKAGWIMSLVAHDMDGDGDKDVLLSDRKGDLRGVSWLENPGAVAATEGLSWPEHRVGGQDYEVMFLDVADLDGDGRQDIVTATADGQILWFQPSTQVAGGWQETRIANPFQVPRGKAVRVGDIDLDGRPDLAHTAETMGNLLIPGVTWLRSPADTAPVGWTQQDVSRDEGTKFDLVQLYDVDGDGDLDMITTEEKTNLGLIWYENPTIPRR